jgi:hypothetical protein
MAKHTPLWQQVPTYPAQLDRSLLAALWPTGAVTGGVATTVANTMDVSVAPGSAAVPLATGQGTALCVWDAAELVAPRVPAAPASGQSRVDLIIVQVRDPDLDGGDNNDFIITSVTGVPAASNPAVPATPANALLLYRLIVPGGVANLNTAALLDFRPSSILAVNKAPGCQVSQNASITVTSYGAVPWDTVAYDPSGMYAVGTGIFTIKTDGRYALNMALRSDRAVSWSIGADVDPGTGTFTAWTQASTTTPGTNNSAIYAPGSVGLRAGSRVRFICSGTPANTVGGSPFNFASVSYQQPF